MGDDDEAAAAVADALRDSSFHPEVTFSVSESWAGVCVVVRCRTRPLSAARRQQRIADLLAEAGDHHRRQSHHVLRRSVTSTQQRVSEALLQLRDGITGDLVRRRSARSRSTSPALDGEDVPSWTCRSATATSRCPARRPGLRRRLGTTYPRLPADARDDGDDAVARAACRSPRRRERSTPPPGQQRRRHVTDRLGAIAGATPTTAARHRRRIEVGVSAVKSSHRPSGASSQASSASGSAAGSSIDGCALT